MLFLFFFFSSRRRHTRCSRDWSSDVCSSDLAKVENQAACCSPSMSKQTADYVLPVVSACCGTPATDDPEHKFHGDLRDLLSRYNVNDYAASVKVFAIKAS